MLAGRVGRVDELSCTLPSTTPTSLVSLGTGVPPGEHGVLGFTVNVPGTDRVLTHIVWRDDPPPATWQPVPTLYARAAAAGIDRAVVLPALFAGSGLTLRPTAARVRRSRARATTWRRDARALRADPTRLRLHARVDTAAHVDGIASPRVGGGGAGDR